MGLHKLARIAMMSPISGWPPVSGHPAMEVAIIVQFRRARHRGTREVGVRCPSLSFRLCLNKADNDSLDNDHEMVTSPE